MPDITKSTGAVMPHTPRILIVDDEPRMCDSLRTLLSNRGYEIHTSHSGKKAFEYLSEHNFDLVILDMLMPDVDGYKVMDHINTHSPDTLIIVMTGHATVESAVTALKSGAYDYLTKPFGHEELLKRVENALDHNKLKHDRKVAEEALLESETRYRELVQNANSIIFRRDIHGKITFFNEFAQNFFGYTENEIVGKNVVGTIVPETDSGGRNLAAMIRDIGLHPDLYAINENENMRRNGERMWIAWTNKAIRDKDGNILEILCVGNDITQRKQAEEALRESEQRFREMAALLPTIICEMDTDLRITYVNEVGFEKLGYSEDDLAAGIHGMDLIHPDDREKAAKGLEKTIRGEGITTAEYRLLRKDGSEMPALLNAAVIYADSTFIGFRTTATDITEQKKLEQQLRQAQKLESIGTLAGGISHDFNNLLMGIQGHVSLMLMDMDPAHPDCERLKNIEKQIQSGTRLTSHLLGYARKGKYEIKALDLNQLVEGTAQTFARTRKDVTIHREFAEDLLPVQADAAQIEQVLLNLFVNSADAMPGGGNLILKTINVTHEDMKGGLYEAKQGNYVLLTVTDTGTGMDKETTERIFDPFFTTKEMGRGTGLGLASAYGIMKAHGGYIDVDSKKGHGTTLSIYLPASGKKVQRVAGTSEEIAKGTGTVLFVDDEEVVLEVGQELLQAMGYRVLIAKDGKEAIKVYRNNQDDINLVVLDMVMPNMGGGEAYDRIKEINPNAKVLLSSGYSIDGEASEILERGCDGFLQKPFTMKQLSGKMRGILEKT
jgi:PAS domain S-box-containing protein